MLWIKKFIIVFILLIAGLLLFISSQAKAQEPVYVTLFYSETCPHCAEEKLFLDKLTDKYSYVKLRELEASEYNEVFRKVSQRLGQPARGVPYTVIGEEVIVGYLNDRTTGQRIRKIGIC